MYIFCCCCIMYKICFKIAWSNFKIQLFSSKDAASLMNACKVSWFEVNEEVQKIYVLMCVS